MLTFKEFYEICEGKKPNTPPHAVPGTYKVVDGVKSYTLQSHSGPAGKPKKKEIEKLIVNRSGGGAVKRELMRREKAAKKVKEELQTEQSPTMEPNLYNQQVARQSATWKGKQIRQSHGEMQSRAQSELAAKKARLKAIMSR